MKKVLRNNLWLMIIAWCMFLNGYSIIGGIISIFAFLILFNNIHNVNVGRILMIASIYMLINLVFTIFSSVNSFNDFPFFCSVVSINAAMFNERLYKEKITKLEKLSIIMLLCFIIFVSLTLLLPDDIIFDVARINMFYLIILIFMPYTSEVVIAFIKKESKRKHKYNVSKVVKDSKA